MLHRTERVVWRLSGADPVGFLEATTTQDHTGQQAGETRWCCVLDPHGRVLAFLRSIPLSDGSVLLDGESVCEQGIAWLSSIAPLSRCTITRADELMVVVGDEPAGDAIATAPRADGLAGLDSLVERSDPFPEPDPSVEAERIATGWPRFGVDITSEQIVNNTPLLALTVSFTKGCYRGQETVAKIRNLGHARRGYARVQAGAPIPAGAAISIDGTESGRVTSAAGDRAIAIVRAEHRDAAATIDGATVTLTPLEIGDPLPPPPPPVARARSIGRR